MACSVTLALLLFAVLVQISLVSSEAHDSTLIGYGVQRLKKHTSRVNIDGHKHLKDSVTQSCDNIVQYWYTDAIIDNFAPVNEQKKWEGSGQRYWINEEFWGGIGSPIFVFIGGEGQEACTRLTDKMYMYTLAEEHNAMLVDVEHRFYGESYPTTDMSTENLKYLSSAQALADLARVIASIKATYATESSQVITVGGSYPGNLAAWFRLKYPSVSHGSIASSAPVTATLNFYQYMEVVASSILYYSGQQCYDAFTVAAEQVACLASGGPGSDGMKQLETDFQTCSTIDNDLDLAVLYSDLMGNVQGTVQYNRESSSMNVTDICAIMTASSDSYSQFVKLSATYREANGVTCEDASWTDMIEYLSSIDKDATNSARPWVYQTCNEFGYYQTTDSENQPFTSWSELNLNFSRAMCFASFNGWTADPQTSWINEEYGNVNIEGTNIVFPSGTIDPWHVLGVTNSTPPLPQSSEVPVYILGTAHCNDLYAPKSSDSESLTYAREVISSYVSSWLA